MCVLHRLFELLLHQFIISSMTTLRAVILLTCLLTALTMKITPIKTLNQTNFKNIVGRPLDQYLEKGSPKEQTWFVLFKIPNCQYCQQAELLFTNTYIEYNRRLIAEGDKLLENNIQFAQIDCESSAALCSYFDLPHYPTFNLIETNGDLCVYEGGILPNQMVDYLQARKQGNHYEKCRFVGKVTFWTRYAGYLDHIVEMMNYNTMLFIIAFMVGPFLFGFVFSKIKKNKELKQEGEVVASQLKKQL